MRVVWILAAGLLLTACTRDWSQYEQRGTGGVGGYPDTGGRGDDGYGRGDDGLSCGVPGDVVTCSCADGWVGSQICLSDGTYGECVCGSGVNVGYSGYGYGGSGGGSGGNAGSGIESGGTVDLFDPDEVCAGMMADPVPVEIQVETQVPYEVIVPQPVAIYVMLDRSLSMEDNDKWPTAVSSINTFVNDPASDFIDMALQYFPIDGAPCDGSMYDTPAVPMGSLPDNATNISDSLAGVQLADPTPIEPALRGMTSFCEQFQQQNPEESCVGVFVSGGAPTLCNGDTNVLIGIAQTAFDNSNVKTFTVGMQGADLNLLNQIAIWGGTDCTPNPDGTANPVDGHACDVSAGMTLLQAFEAIREFVTELEERTVYRTEIMIKISECEWGIPEMPEGEAFNKDMFNVVFSEPGGEDVIFGRVLDATQCKSWGGAWYYDNPDEPTMVIACPQTCEYIKSVEGGDIDFEFGCEVVIMVE